MPVRGLTVHDQCILVLRWRRVEHGDVAGRERRLQAGMGDLWIGAGGVARRQPEAHRLGRRASADQRGDTIAVRRLTAVPLAADC